MALQTKSELAGLAVMSLSGGERLGRIQDVVFHPSDARLTGFLVDAGGLFTKPKFLPVNQVNSLGADALTVANAEALAETNPAPDDPDVFEGKPLEGRTVLNASGTVLGKIFDVVVDTVAMTVPEFVLATGLIENALHGKPRLPMRLVQAIGKDSVVVSDAYDPKAAEADVPAP